MALMEQVWAIKKITNLEALSSICSFKCTNLPHTLPAAPIQEMLDFPQLELMPKWPNQVHK